MSLILALNFGFLTKNYFFMSGYSRTGQPLRNILIKYKNIFLPDLVGMVAIVMRMQAPTARFRETINSNN